MVYFILGIFVIMLDVIFAVGFAIYKNKFYRVSLLIFIVYSLVFSFFLLVDVFNGELLGEYIGMMGYVAEGYFRITGEVFPFNIDLNVLSYMLGYLLLVIVAYMLLIRFASKIVRGIGVRVKIDREKDKIILLMEGEKNFIELQLGFIRITVRVILLTSLVVQLGLFYFWIYKDQLNIIYFYGWLCLLFLLLLVAVLFVLSLRNMMGELYIQLLFMNYEELKYVKNVFERYLNGEKQSLRLVEYDVNVQLYVEMGIFRVPTGFSIDYVDKAILFISKEHLDLYLKVKARSGINES